MDWTWILHGLGAALWVGLSLRAELAWRRARQIQSTAWTIIDSTKKAQTEALAVLKSRALTTAELQAFLNRLLETREPHLMSAALNIQKWLFFSRSKYPYGPKRLKLNKLV